MGIIDQLIRFTGFDTVMRNLRALSTGPADISMAMKNSGQPIQDLENSMSTYSLITRLHKERRERYRDYEAMDDYGDISVALDIYAEEATQTDLVKGVPLWVEGDAQYAQLVTDMFRRTRIHSGLFGMARTLAKYGDMFIMPRYAANGIDDVLFIPPKHVDRKGQGIDKIIQFRTDNRLSGISPRKDGIFYPWELTHFRILSFGDSHFYGRSLLEPSRKRWLHLKLIEDCVAIYRLNRAVERLVFYIDTGAMGPQEAFEVIQRYRQEYSNRRRYLDPSKGSFEMQYDPTNMMENWYIPVNGGNPTLKVDHMSPLSDQGRLQDLEHFNAKLYVALGIPKDYLTGDISGAWNSREALSLQDVRFSRKIHRLQRALKEGLDTMARLHLVIVTGSAEKAAQADIRINMADVSKIARQQYEAVLLNRVTLILQLSALGQQLQLAREPWLNYILPEFLPDVPPDFLQKIIIPDATLAKLSKFQEEEEVEKYAAEIQPLMSVLREAMAESNGDLGIQPDYHSCFSKDWGEELLQANYHEGDVKYGADFTKISQEDVLTD